MMLREKENMRNQSFSLKATISFIVVTEKNAETNKKKLEMYYLVKWYGFFAQSNPEILRRQGIVWFS